MPGRRARGSAPGGRESTTAEKWTSSGAWVLTLVATFLAHQGCVDGEAGTEAQAGTRGRVRAPAGDRGGSAAHRPVLTVGADGRSVFRGHAVASPPTSTTTNGVAAAGITPQGQGSLATAPEPRHSGGSRTCSRRTPASSITQSDLDRLDPMAARSLDYRFLPKPRPSTCPGVMRRAPVANLQNSARHEVCYPGAMTLVAVCVCDIHRRSRDGSRGTRPAGECGAQNALGEIEDGRRSMAGC